MGKIYQPVVKEEAENIIKGLVETDFFTEYEITSHDYTREYLCDKLTEKYINNGFDNDEDLFDEDEFIVILKEIIAGSLLMQLKEKGFIDSYDDDSMDEEMFFLTEEGKKELKKNKLD